MSKKKSCLAILFIFLCWIYCLNISPHKKTYLKLLRSYNLGKQWTLLVDDQNVLFCFLILFFPILHNNSTSPSFVMLPNSHYFFLLSRCFWQRLHCEEHFLPHTKEPKNNQAVALYATSYRSVFYQCGIFGYQDSLSSKIYSFTESA